MPAHLSLMILAPILANAGAETGATWQTWAALGVVAVAAVWLGRKFFRKSGHGSACGGGECGAVSRDARKLQARLKKMNR